jgi:hypothetical protein
MIVVVTLSVAALQISGIGFSWIGTILRSIFGSGPM